MSHDTRGHWCDITVLNVHAPTEDKTDDVKDSFYKDLDHILDKLPKYHKKILLGDFNAKVGEEDICKLMTGKESLHKINNDNEVTVSNTISKNLLKVQCFHIAPIINLLGYTLVERFQIN
jgi:exonuclease III